MDVARLIAAAVTGALVGVGTGYLVWGLGNADLEVELAKTKGWLMDEIRRSDVRQAEVEARRGKQEADLQKARLDLQKARVDLERSAAELRRTKAVLAEAVSDWKLERERRRVLEERLESTTHGTLERPRPRGTP